MIRLIASDLDGTLLQNGAQALSKEAMDLIRKAGELGIHFVAASGRQYPNMKRLFGPLWKDVIFAAENGSLIVQQDIILDKSVMPPALAKELIRDLYSSECCDVMVSGIHSVYMRPKPRSASYVDHILYTLKNTMTIVEDLPGLEEEVIKVSAIVYDDQIRGLENSLRPKWAEHFNMAVAGDEWLDFTLTNKGEAIEKLRARFQLTPGELVAFGDNYNDESMFRSVQYSYAMNTAHEDIRKMARHSCNSVEGVLTYLMEYLGEVTA